MIKLQSSDDFQITGSQIRAARAMLRWSAKDLAQAARIGVATVSRAEVEEGVPTITAANRKAIQGALEDAGIAFIWGANRDVGVTLSKNSH